MGAKREFRNRSDVQVEILDALVDRNEEGMTVLELRAAVDHDIDRIEAGLAALKDDRLIAVEENASRLKIYPAERVVPDVIETEPDESGLLESVRDRLGL